MSADAKLKAYIDRILRCREAEDEAKRDTKEVYAELAAEGYEKAIVGQVVTFLRKREKDGDKVAEQSAKFDLYLEAYERPSHAHTREDRPDSGLNIITKQTEITASDGSPSVSTSLTTREAEESVVPHSPETATECAAPEKDAAADERSVEADGGAALVRTDSDQSDEGGNDAQDQHVNLDRRHHFQSEENTSETTKTAEQAGGEHEVATGSALRAGLADPTSNTGEGAASALPAGGIVIESVPPAPMKRPDFAACFPELSNAAYALLHDEIQANGICQPIVRHGDVIVEGWDRYNISRELGFNYPVQPYSGDDVLLDVIEWQRAARNFTQAQEKKIAADLAKEIPHRADDIFAAFGLAESLEVAE